MKMMKLKLLSIILAGILLVGCSTPSKGGDNPFNGTPDKDSVTVNLGVEPPTLNSIVANDNISKIIFENTMVGLVKQGADGEIEPEIATKWEANEESTKFTFTLRNDAKWTNGDSLTAHDFVFAWLSAIDSKTASPIAPNIYRLIKNGEKFFKGEVDKNEVGVRAIDDYTLEVEVEEPYPTFVENLTTPVFFPLNQKVYEAYGIDGYGSEADKLVTNGPYTVKEWNHDSNIVLSKNEDFYNSENINIPKINFVMIGDSNAAMNAFKTGEIDAFDLYGDQISDLQAQGDDVVKSYSDNTAYVLQFNMKQKKSSNGKINRALAMAIDMDNLCKEVFKDGSLPATGITPPEIKSLSDDGTYAQARGDIITFDQKEAKKLFDEGLKEIGMKAEDLKLVYSGNDTLLGKVQAEYFKEEWKKVLGIDVTVDLLPFNARIQNLMNGEFDIAFNGWGGSNTYAYIGFMVKGNENNFGGYDNPKFDSIIDKVLKENDDAQLQQYFIDAEKLIIEDGAMVPLYHTSVVYATSNKIEGMQCNASRKYNFTDGAKIRGN